MIDLLLGLVGVIFSLVTLWFLLHRTTALGVMMQTEAEMARINLDHIASALVGLSELLDDADEIITQTQAIPSTGEVLGQILQSFIMSRVQASAPMLAPLVEEGAADFISQAVSGEADASTQTIQSETETSE